MSNLSPDQFGDYAPRLAGTERGSQEYNDRLASRCGAKDGTYACHLKTGHAGAHMTHPWEDTDNTVYKFGDGKPLRRVNNKR